jgi:hypothetical protein
MNNINAICSHNVESNSLSLVAHRKVHSKYMCSMYRSPYMFNESYKIQSPFDAGFYKQGSHQLSCNGCDYLASSLVVTIV